MSASGINYLSYDRRLGSGSNNLVKSTPMYLSRLWIKDFGSQRLSIILGPFLSQHSFQYLAILFNQPLLKSCKESPNPLAPTHYIFLPTNIMLQQGGNQWKPFKHENTRQNMPGQKELSINQKPVKTLCCSPGYNFPRETTSPVVK